MSSNSRRSSPPPWPIALLAASVAVSSLWLLPCNARDGARDTRRARSGEDATASDTLTSDDATARRDAGFGTVATSSHTPSSAPPKPAGACAPAQSTRCHQGDVYSVDGCGQLEVKSQECGDSLCRDGACATRDPAACRDLPLEGRCDGDVIRGCLGGVPYARDCAALGKRCVIGDEGALCRTPSPDDCTASDTPPRCAGNVLVRCEDGLLVKHSCTTLRARCEDGDDGAPAACVAATLLTQAPNSSDPCGPCGCDGESDNDFGSTGNSAASRNYGAESCNGIDDDGDRFIDEDVECPPIEVVAFIVADARGESSYSREDVEREITRINAVYAQNRDALRTQVTLAAVATLQTPSYLALDDRELGRAALELASHPAMQSAPAATVRVPVVFTDAVLIDDAPKAGVSTLPNGFCGGLRVSRGLESTHGIVALSKSRSETTAAHELGHFFGLCHTHEVADAALRRVARWRSEDGRGYEQNCEPACTQQGDGICDTPTDPGPPECAYDVQCNTLCPGGEAPYASNVMSYYTACRSQLTSLQSVRIRKSRVLLEGFSRCADPSACPCALPGLTDVQSVGQLVPCPEQMSCRPLENGSAGCTLDGPFVAQHECRVHEQCGHDLLCINGRCAPFSLSP